MATLERINPMDKCPFCGSKEMLIKSPYVEKGGKEIYDFCCFPQKKNREHLDKRFGREVSNRPSMDEISK